MPTRHPYRRGDVVMVEVPYSDEEQNKPRPGIVLSTDVYHDDWNEVLVIALSSQQPKTLRQTDYLLQDWKAAGLHKRSWIRSRLVKLHYRRFKHKIGRLTDRDLGGVEACIRLATGL